MKRSLYVPALLVGAAILFLAGRVSLEVSRKAPDTRAADEAAIRAADSEWLEAVRAKDLERTVSFYADDASVLPVSEPIVTGKEAIRSEWAHLFAIPGFANPTSQMTHLEVSRAGDLAHARGTYTVSLEDVDGSAVTERGKWVVVWEKQPDGAWKIAVEIYNTDSPPPIHK